MALTFPGIEDFYEVDSLLAWKPLFTVALADAFVIDSVYLEQSHRFTFISSCPDRKLINAASQALNQNLKYLAVLLPFLKTLCVVQCIHTCPLHTNLCQHI